MCAVDVKNGGVLVGAILRKVLCTLIKQKAFGPPTANPLSSQRLSPLVNWGTLEGIYPVYPDIADLQINEIEAKSWIDLRPYIDAAPYTISEHASVQVW